jgi:hypothetical protein
VNPITKTFRSARLVASLMRAANQLQEIAQMKLSTQAFVQTISVLVATVTAVGQAFPQWAPATSAAASMLHSIGEVVGPIAAIVAAGAALVGMFRNPDGTHAKAMWDGTLK